MSIVKLHIPKEVYEKVMYWVKKADFEVSGFGTVLYDKAEHAFVVQDAILLKQIGNSAHTDIDPESLSKALWEVHKRKLPGELNWWWHSHVQMATFWSSQDTSTINEIAKQGYCVATVFNQKEELRSAYATHVQTNHGPLAVFQDEIATNITEYYDPNTLLLWDKEFADNVTKQTYTYENYTGYPYLDSEYERVWGLKPDENHSTVLTNPLHMDKPKWKKPKGYSDHYWRELCEDAELLRMSPKEYEKILDSNDYDKLNELDNKLLNLRVDRNIHV